MALLSARQKCHARARIGPRRTRARRRRPPLVALQRARRRGRGQGGGLVWAGRGGEAPLSSEGESERGGEGGGRVESSTTQRTLHFCALKVPRQKKHLTHTCAFAPWQRSPPAPSPRPSRPTAAMANSVVLAHASAISNCGERWPCRRPAFLRCRQRTPSSTPCRASGPRLRTQSWPGPWSTPRPGDRPPPAP